MGVRGQNIDVGHGGWKGTQSLDCIQAEEHPLGSEHSTDGIDIDAPPRQVVRTGDGHQASIFINLSLNIHHPNLAEFADVHQTYLDTPVCQRHPRINVGGIAVVIDENILTPFHLKPGRHLAQGQ